ncbi:MAG: TA system VapC family ribonuclease toxin [Terriglobales bacterium]
MFLVDTNLLVYAANVDAPEHGSARAFLEACRRGSEAWLGAWSIFYEFLRVTTHPSVLPRPLALTDAWGFLRVLSASPTFQLIAETERHAEVVGDLARRQPGVRGNHVHDFHIAALMVEHGVREIRTADSDFHQFRFLTVVNPLLPGA